MKRCDWSRTKGAISSDVGCRKVSGTGVDVLALLCHST